VVPPPLSGKIRGRTFSSPPTPFLKDSCMFRSLSLRKDVPSSPSCSRRPRAQHLFHARKVPLLFSVAGFPGNGSFPFYMATSTLVRFLVIVSLCRRFLCSSRPIRFVKAPITDHFYFSFRYGSEKLSLRASLPPPHDDPSKPQGRHGFPSLCNQKPPFWEYRVFLPLIWHPPTS